MKSQNLFHAFQLGLRGAISLQISCKVLECSVCMFRRQHSHMLMIVEVYTKRRPTDTNQRCKGTFIVRTLKQKQFFWISMCAINRFVAVALFDK